MTAAADRSAAALDLVTLVRHMEWADARLWEAVLALPAERAAPAMLEKLHHVHYVQAVFFARAHGEKGTPPKLESFDGLAPLAAWAREQYPAMHATVAALDEPSRGRPVPAPEQLRAMVADATPADATAADAILQVVTHTIHHRGQLNLVVRELGGEPPRLDLILWAWNGKPEARWPDAAATGA